MTRVDPTASVPSPVRLKAVAGRGDMFVVPSWAPFTAIGDQGA